MAGISAADSDKVLSIIRVIGAEFADMADDVVTTWIELTAPMVSKARFGDLYHQALAYLTAHRIKEGGGGDNPLGTIDQTLRMSSVSQGGISVGINSSQLAGQGSDGELALTVYGQTFLSIRNSCIVTIISAGEA